MTRYMIATGWHMVDANDRTSLWSPPDESIRSEVRVVLPAHEDFQDYASAMTEALRAVAYVERRLPREVTSDVDYGGADSLSVRLTPDAPSGEAPLRLAQAAVDALRDLVVGSAASIDINELVLPARRPQRAEWYGDNARIGMQAGSFVLTLALPLEPTPTADADADFAQQPLLDLAPSPFGRQVTMRMMSAVLRAQQLADAVSAGDENVDAFGGQATSTVNATELAALGELGGPDFAPYDLRFAPSPLVPSEDDQHRVISVTPGQQRIFAEASEFLRTKQPRSGVLVVGLVVRLFRASAFGPGEVVIEGYDDDSQRSRRFKAELTEGDYNQALIAHSSGLQVQVQGDLQIRGTRLTLRQITHFSLIPGLEEEEE
jgi:hypothetical protein